MSQGTAPAAQPHRVLTDAQRLARAARERLFGQGFDIRKATPQQLAIIRGQAPRPVAGAAGGFQRQDQGLLSGQINLPDNPYDQPTTPQPDGKAQSRRKRYR